MRYRVVVTPTAEANLDEILRFIALDNPASGRKFFAALRARLGTLAEMPRRCPLAPEDGLDSLEIRHLIHGNYRIIFTIDPGQVTILQVRHGARRPMAEDQ
jgi:plasmid stabilization system protein ParE